MIRIELLAGNDSLISNSANVNTKLTINPADNDIDGCTQSGHMNVSKNVVNAVMTTKPAIANAKALSKEIAALCIGENPSTSTGKPIMKEAI